MQFLPLDRIAHLKRFILVVIPNARVYELAGDRNRKYRQAIIQLITGEKRPLAKCGVGEVENLLFQLANITEWTCEADKEKQLQNWILNAEKPQ